MFYADEHEFGDLFKPIDYDELERTLDEDIENGSWYTWEETLAYGNALVARMEREREARERRARGLSPDDD